MVCARMVMGRGVATSDGAAMMDQVTALSLCLVFYIKWQNVESLPDADLVLNANVFQFSLSCLGCRAAHSPGAQQCRETCGCPGAHRRQFHGGLCDRRSRGQHADANRGAGDAAARSEPAEV